MALVFGMYVVNNFNCRGFGPLLEDKLCLIFKLAPSVCRMTFPILASLLVRVVVLLPFQLLRLSLATPFFFPAEDGIRVYKVTGVQTCALPIFTVAQQVPEVRQADEGGDRVAPGARVG